MALYAVDSQGNRFKVAGAVPGPPGPAGASGPPGQTGAGVPAGGAIGQFLAKSSAADHDTHWVDPPESGVPAEDPMFVGHVSVYQTETALPNVMPPGDGSIAVGGGSVCYGNDSAAIGSNVVNGGFCSVLEGSSSCPPVYNSTTQSYELAPVSFSHLEGNVSVSGLTVSTSHIEGACSLNSNDLSGQIMQSHIEGTVSSPIEYVYSSHIEGNHSDINPLNISNSHLEGVTSSSKIQITEGSHVEGKVTYAEVNLVGNAVHIEGEHGGDSSATTALNPGYCGNGIHIGGKNVSVTSSAWLNPGAFLHGCNSGISYDAGVSHGADIVMGSLPNLSAGDEHSVLILGDGSAGNPSNAFRVSSSGVYGGAYHSTGADYAEMFEWCDGNENEEDRCGLFVSIDGEKIRPATEEDDFVVGVVSGNPSVVGDSHDDQWHGMYERDIFGRIVFENIEHEEQTEEVTRPTPDDPNHKEVRITPAYVEVRPKISQEYNVEEEYIPRSKRNEWALVGMAGKLIVIDDGTCQVNGWCYPGIGGIATKSDKKTRYRVLKRLDATHIKILIT